MKNKTFICNGEKFERVNVRKALSLLTENKPFKRNIYLVPFYKDGHRGAILDFENRFNNEYETYRYVYKEWEHEDVCVRAFYIVLNEYEYYLKSYTYELDTIGLYICTGYSE